MNACLALRTLLRNLPEYWYSEHVMLEIQRAYAWGYANALWGKREAVRLALQANMEMAVARGKGYHAAKRAARACEAVGRDIMALNARIARNRRQWAADEAAERIAESRSLAHHYATNIHE